MRVLTVNAGSTSLKLAWVVDGVVGTVPRSVDEALASDAPDCIAHRVVHGGPRTEATVVDDAALADLRSLIALAPLHQPPSLSAIEDCRRWWPDVPNVACFDTAFHTTIPPAARTYALPARYRDAVRVYGFHGISYAWATARLRALVPDARRVLIAHLGGGQSLCGTADGRSAITTMGFTPTDGLVMGTRCGSLDPGAVLWLAERLDETEDLHRLLEEQSGLMGLCGTADMREVHVAAAAGHPDAQFAFDVWRHRIVTLAGACVAALGGLDVLAFTGGIGENDPFARAALVDGLAWLGAAITDRSTVAGDREITASGSAVRCFVIASREELQLAAEAEVRLRT